MAGTDAKIEKVAAREIIDSFGNPAVKVEVSMASGRWAQTGVSSGAFTGVQEAIELRDGNKERYNGEGVLKAVENVNRVVNEKNGLRRRKTGVNRRHPHRAGGYIQ